MPNQSVGPKPALVNAIGERIGEAAAEEPQGVVVEGAVVPADWVQRHKAAAHIDRMLVAARLCRRTTTRIISEAAGQLVELGPQICSQLGVGLARTGGKV